MPFSLFLALKYLRPKRSFISVVTVISIVGVILGVSILVIVLSVMTGFDDMWRQKILSFKPHITVVGRYGVIEDEEDVCKAIEKVPGVTGVAPSIETRVLMRYMGRTAAPIVVAVDPARARKVSKIPDSMEEGTFNIEDERIVAGYDIAGQMHIPVGSKVLVYSPQNVKSQDEMYLPLDLELSGVFNMGVRDYDGGFVLTSLEVGQKLVGLEKGAYSIYVMTEDPFKFDQYAAQIRDALGPAFDVRTWKEIDSVLFQALSHEKTMMFILLVFITVVAIFCVTNTLIVITVEKTDEIGLLKALGFSSGQITATFVLHGWIQCLVGTIGGIGVGLLILTNLKRIVAFLLKFNVEVFPKSIYGLSEIPWKTSGQELLNISIFVIIFCTLASILPAWRAARLDPVKALRKE